MGDGPPALRIVPATERDTPVVLRLIKALAEYEHVSGTVTATEDGLRDALFGPHPAAEALIAYVNDAAVGLAVFFPTFSTFTGTSGLFIEDLIVDAGWRRRGVGRALLAHVVRVAASRGCRRVSWSVLRWNEPAIQFYRALGAELIDEWAICAISGDAFERLALDDAMSR
jgi:GNAT superfamily N-acetyltransferase